MPETTFDHMVRGQHIYERYSCQNRLNWWSGRSDGEYCILKAAYMAYTHENELLGIMRHYNPLWRDVKATQQRIVDSHWNTFVDLSRLYARMDKSE